MPVTSTRAMARTVANPGDDDSCCLRQILVLPPVMWPAGCLGLSHISWQTLRRGTARPLRPGDSAAVYARVIHQHAEAVAARFAQTGDLDLRPGYDEDDAPREQIHSKPDRGR